MSFTRLQMRERVKLSDFGKVSEGNRGGIENDGRMSLSRFAEQWQEQQNSEEPQGKTPYKPYIRNRYKRRRTSQLAQTDVNPA